MKKIRVFLAGFLSSILGLLLFSSPAFASYKDVEESHPYQEAISYLELVGAIDSGKYFRPNDFVTKAEFFKMLFEVFDEEAKGYELSFKDVPKDEWFAPYAELALKYKFVESSLFEPAIVLRRGETLGLLMKAYGQGAPIIPASQRSPLFADVLERHPLYSLLARASELDILTPDNSKKYAPYQKLTRSEASNMIYQFEQWHTVDLASSDEKEEFYKSDIFADIWNRILTDLYLAPGSVIDQDALFQVAVKAVLESLNDPYTKYFTGEEASEFMDTLEGELEGIGAILLQDEASMEVFITEFLEDSPASTSGLKAGDQIIAVDGISIDGMLLQEVLSRIKGPAGTTVSITVLREDGTTPTYELTRAELKLILLTGEIYDEDAWLFTIKSFGDDILEELLSALETLQAEVENPSAIILDLRGNPGGYINMMNYVAGLFVPFLNPLVILDYGGYQETIYNGDTGAYKDIPLYILVDEYTASASEILALTLQEAADVTVIGKQTFGKGSAQELITYWDGSILKMTVAEWLSSEGNSVEGVGVTPNILITEESEEKDLWLEEVKKLLK